MPDNNDQELQKTSKNVILFNVRKYKDTFHCPNCKYKTTSHDNMEHHLKMHVYLDIF
jgi:hypothetical protein